MERFHSTCSAKHDDSALESVSKSLNQGLKIWMLYDNVGSLARTCRSFAGHRKRRDFLRRGHTIRIKSYDLKMRFVDALRCVGGPRFSTGLTASRTKRFGGRLRCPMLCLKAGLDIASAVSCYGIGKTVIYSDASME